MLAGAMQKEWYESEADIALKCFSQFKEVILMFFFNFYNAFLLYKMETRELLIETVG